MSLTSITTRPSELIVDLAAIEHNLRQVRAFAPGCAVMAIVKANAYGHGLVEVARLLESCGADYLGVAFVEEGVELRRAGLTLPVLVLGGVVGSQIGLFIENNLDITASSISKLEQIDSTAKQLGKRARVHLKFDTGMERIGVHYYNAETLFAAAKKSSHCEIIGVYSHLATGEESDCSFAELQFNRFREVTELGSSLGVSPQYRHLLNSGGMLRIPQGQFEMVRPGLLLYGVAPSIELKGALQLKPALSLRSSVVYFKCVKAGASVSYGRRSTAPVDTRVVTVPIGYGDGYLRGYFSKAEVVIRGSRRKVIGNICMDQLMVDLTPQGEAYSNDEVILIGKQGSEEISVEELAAWAGTVPHEVLTSLNARLPRRFSVGVSGADSN